MRKMLVPVRITNTAKCREGFYLLINGARLHFKTKAQALHAVEACLSMQRLQVVSVREYAARRKGTKPPVPPGGVA